MALEATVAGEECSLVLRVVGYERPAATSGADANWPSGEAELHAATTGSFAARLGVSLRTEELADFRRQLARLLETLTGEAELRHMEDQLGCTVRLKDGVGVMEAFVREQIGAELREARTDQSYLQQSLRQLDAIVSAFPMRGDALA